MHSRSNQHLNGRMSPSPISSPRTTSGSSTPLTGGNGAIPFPHLKPSVYLQEGFGNISKPPTNNLHSCGPSSSSSSYHDPNADIFRGMQPGSHIFPESDALGKQFGRTAHGELYDGHSVLADRVSRQLLMMNPSLDLNPCSMLPTRTSGI